MCGLCGVLGIEHWADGLSAAGPTSRQMRLRRAALLNKVLSPYRVNIDDWQGAKIAVHGPTGRTELADTLADLWPKVEVVASCSLDPLDPTFLRYLRQVTRREDQ